MFSYLVLVLGIFLAIIAVMLVFAPELLKRISDFMNRNVFSDKSIYLHRYVMAAICLCVSIILFYLYYRYGRWVVF